MGAVTWIIAGCLAGLVGHFVERSRKSWPLEVTAGVIAAIAAGAAATALDFGGWREADWRAAVFAFFVGLAAIGLVRLLKSK